MSKAQCYDATGRPRRRSAETDILLPALSSETSEASTETKTRHRTGTTRWLFSSAESSDHCRLLQPVNLSSHSTAIRDCQSDSIRRQIEGNSKANSRSASRPTSEFSVATSPQMPFACLVAFCIRHQPTDCRRARDGLLSYIRKRRMLPFHSRTGPYGRQHQDKECPYSAHWLSVLFRSI